jgi:hypothetical protein
MNRVIAEIRAKEFASGIHSVMGMPRNIIMKGVIIPPPPIPPAFANMFITEIRIIPEICSAFGGHTNSLNPSVNYSCVV